MLLDATLSSFVFIISVLFVEPTGSSPPRLMQRSEIAISAESGSDVHLTCSAQGSPPPQFTWYRDVNGWFN